MTESRKYNAEGEEEGGSAPFEILRQYLDHGGWYELNEKTSLAIEDMKYVVAMGPPGGGRTLIIPLAWPDGPMVRHARLGLPSEYPGNLTKLCAHDSDAAVPRNKFRGFGPNVN